MEKEHLTPEATTQETHLVDTPVGTSDSSDPTQVSETPVADAGEKTRDRRGGKGRRDDRRDRGDRREKPKKEFDELLLEVRRVTRVTTGGRRMSFRATILVGNKKGKIGLGVAKGNDVAGAVSKATNEAYKNLFQVPITKGDTVPYPLEMKYKSTRVRILPASEGTGLKAGSSIRNVLELAGYANVLSKMIGSNNKLNNALVTIKALASYKHAEYFSSLREVKVEEVVKEKASEASSVNSEETTKKPVRKAAPKKGSTKKTSEEA